MDRRPGTENGGIGAHRDPRYGVGHGGQAWLMVGITKTERNHSLKTGLLFNVILAKTGDLHWTRLKFYHHAPQRRPKALGS